MVVTLNHVAVLVKFSYALGMAERENWVSMKVRRELVERLTLVAQAENRSTSNMLEVILREFLERLEVPA